MSDALVFDTGPLSHFAEAGWLKIIQALAGVRQVIIEEAGAAEQLQTGVDLRQVFRKQIGDPGSQLREWRWIFRLRSDCSDSPDSGPADLAP